VTDVIAVVLANALLAERLAGTAAAPAPKTAPKTATTGEARQPLDHQKIDHLKSELLATVSHELRSPLAAIKGYAETLLRREDHLPRAERHDFLLAIIEAGRRLDATVTRMLDMSQLATDTYRLERVPVDIERLAAEAVRFLRERAGTEPTMRHTFSIHREVCGPDPHVPLIVAGDHRQLRNLFDNLLDNAVRYSPEGGAIDVLLRSHARRPQAQTCAGRAPHTAAQAGLHTPAPGDVWPAAPLLEITVRDPGIGIPVDQLTRIFERFHQVDTQLTRQGDGMGLGLALCQRIVSLHHGAIWADSVPGAGSQFHVLLPLYDGDDRAESE
jgi:two-component system phosphate regulon sensor histidine kinase PhoR